MGLSKALCKAFYSKQIFATFLGEIFSINGFAKDMWTNKHLVFIKPNIFIPMIY